MNFFSKRIAKENFLWTPILWLMFSNIAYFLFVVFLMIVAAPGEYNPLRETKIEAFFFDPLAMWGYSAFCIPLLNGIAIVVGVILSFFRTNLLSSRTKISAISFLVLFYSLVVYSWSQMLS